MPERDVLRAIMLETSDQVDWLRNNSGVADYDGLRVRYGCGGKGGSDLIGVRRTDGRMVCCEVKGPAGSVSREQHQFLARMRRSHAIALVARSVEDVLAALSLP